MNKIYWLYYLKGLLEGLKTVSGADIHKINNKRALVYSWIELIESEEEYFDQHFEQQHEQCIEILKIIQKGENNGSKEESR